MPVVIPETAIMIGGVMIVIAAAVQSRSAICAILTAAIRLQELDRPRRLSYGQAASSRSSLTIVWAVKVSF